MDAHLLSFLSDVNFFCLSSRHRIHHHTINITGICVSDQGMSYAWGAYYNKVLECVGGGGGGGGGQQAS